jgi:hypothetical protein
MMILCSSKEIWERMICNSHIKVFFLEIFSKTIWDRETGRDFVPIFVSQNEMFLCKERNVCLRIRKWKNFPALKFNFFFD